MNDLIFELPENIQPTILKRFIDIKVLVLFNEYFLMKNIPFDFDVISFYLKLTLNLHFYFLNIVTEENIETYTYRILFDFE